MIDFRTPDRRRLPDRRVNPDRRKGERRKEQGSELEDQTMSFLLEIDGPLLSTDGDRTE